jgi:hypothetical protein
MVRLNERHKGVEPLSRPAECRKTWPRYRGHVSSLWRTTMAARTSRDPDPTRWLVLVVDDQHPPVIGWSGARSRGQMPWQATNEVIRGSALASSRSVPSRGIQVEGTEVLLRVQMRELAEQDVEDAHQIADELSDLLGPEVRAGLNSSARADSGGITAG